MHRGNSPKHTTPYHPVSRVVRNTTHPQILSPAELDGMEHAEKEWSGKSDEVQGGERDGEGECMCVFCLEEEQDYEGGTTEDRRDEGTHSSLCINPKCANKRGEDERKSQKRVG
jgi:hypothetical protein